MVFVSGLQAVVEGPERDVFPSPTRDWCTSDIVHKMHASLVTAHPPTKTGGGQGWCHTTPCASEAGSSRKSSLSVKRRKKLVGTSTTSTSIDASPLATPGIAAVLTSSLHKVSKSCTSLLSVGVSSESGEVGYQSGSVLPPIGGAHHNYVNEAVEGAGSSLVFIKSSLSSSSSSSSCVKVAAADCDGLWANPSFKTPPHSLHVPRLNYVPYDAPLRIPPCGSSRLYPLPPVICSPGFFVLDPHLVCRLCMPVSFFHKL